MLKPFKTLSAMKMSVYSSRYHVSASSAVLWVFRDCTVKELLASRQYLLLGKGACGLWCDGGLWAINLASRLIPLKMDVQLSWEHCNKKTKPKGALSSLLPSGSLSLGQGRSQVCWVLVPQAPLSLPTLVLLSTFLCSFCTLSF